jgi:hypothetical protein
MTDIGIDSLSVAWRDVRLMSAFGGKADIAQTVENVRL